MHESLREKRRSELLIDRATVGLSADEAAELLEMAPDIDDWDEMEFDQIVAELQNRSLHIVGLPGHVRSRVLAAAEPFVGLGVQSPTTNLDEDREAYLKHEEDLGGQPECRQLTPGRTLNRREVFAWLAAAASLLVAALLWLRPTDTNPNRLNGSGAVASLMATSNQRALDEFLAATEDRLLKVDLARGGDPTGQSASGTVYWDREFKRGFVKLTNVAVNDPRQKQYQLWVIDEVRGPEDRPNAGVFDIEQSGTSVFAFRSELEVTKAQGFAVTLEKRGGVAKSDLSRVTLINTGS